MIEFIEETHTYLVDGVIIPSVSEILEPLSKEHYKDIDKDILQNACDRGSCIHLATENIDLEKEYIIDDKWKDYVLQYKKFKALKKPVIKEIELALTNNEYCGRIDRIYKIDGLNWLVDIKTSSEINTKLVQVQEGGYKLLLDYNKINIDKCGVLHLTKTGFKLVEIVPREDVFEALYKIWKYKKE